LARASSNTEPAVEIPGYFGNYTLAERKRERKGGGKEKKKKKKYGLSSFLRSTLSSASLQHMSRPRGGGGKKKGEKKRKRKKGDTASAAPSNLHRTEFRRGARLLKRRGKREGEKEEGKKGESFCRSRHFVSGTKNSG